MPMNLSTDNKIAHKDLAPVEASPTSKKRKSYYKKKWEDYDGSTPLKPMFEEFVRFTLAGIEPREAAIKAGYAEKTAARSAHQHLNNPIVKKRIDWLSGGGWEIQRVGEQEVLNSAAYIAFFDPIDLYDSYGERIPVKLLPPRVRRAIKKITRVEKPDGSVVETIEVWDKDKALEKLFRNYGLYDADNAQKVSQFLLMIGKADLSEEDRKRVKSKMVDDGDLEGLTDDL